MSYNTLYLYFIKQTEAMKTIKDILTENRNSVISSLKFAFKVYDTESLKVEMIQFLAYAEENGDVKYLSESKRVKSDLKEMIERMAYIQKRQQPAVKKMKLEDIMAGIAEIEYQKGNKWNPILKEWVKR